MEGSLSNIVESRDVQVRASGFVFTEGPLWHPDGYLLFVDIRQSLILRLGREGQVEVVRRDSGAANGLTFDLRGRLVMCEGDNRRVTRMEADGRIVTLAERWEGRRLNRPNDVVCRSDGSIYFTDPAGRLSEAERELGFSGVFRIAPDGSLSPVATDLEYPNGLAFSPDENILYVANTRQAMYIQAYDVRPDGSLTNGRTFADMSSRDAEGVPDGMKVDLLGRVYCTGPGGCWVFDPFGNHLATIRLPEVPANCAWGGPDSRTMFFTARTSVYSLRMKTAGVVPPWVFLRGTPQVPGEG